MKSCACVWLGALLGVLAAGAFAQTVFVTPAGSGLADGSDWNNALGSLQAAVDACTAEGSIIFLKQGVYSNLAEVAIAGKPGLSIKGGYSGNPGDPYELAGSPTVLTRDTSVNIRILGMLASTVTLERVTVQGGFLATGNGIGVAATNNCRLVLTNCVLAGNVSQFAARGAGLYMNGGVLEAVDCLFSNNYISADAENVKYGGGAALENATSLWTRVRFSGNYLRLRHSHSFGGALYLSGGRADLTDCVFENNSSVGYQFAAYPRGGALYASAVNPLTVTDCEFTGNYANGPNRLGNVLFLTGAGLSAVFDSCRIAGSRTLSPTSLPPPEDVHLEAAGAVTFRHASLVGAPAGALRKSGAGVLTITNSLFALGSGTALFLQAGTVQIVNSTVADNQAWAVSNAAASVSMSDSIVWGNGGGLTGTVSATYSCVQEGWAGAGNLSDDPLFIAGYYLSESGQPHQTASSPCLDAGSDSAAAFGLDGRTTRTTGASDSGVVDLGFHQEAGPGSLSNLLLHVDAAAGSDANDGWTAGAALRTIGEGLNRVLPGGTILVAAGAYTNGAEPMPLTVVAPHVTVRGAGPDATVLDGLGATRVWQAHGAGRLRLENMAVRNGYMLFGRGAGLHLTGGETAISNCLFANNRVLQSAQAIATYGGGIFLEHGNLSVVDSVFATNRLDRSGYTGNARGGALYAIQSALAVERTRFSNNSVAAQHWDNYGGAIAQDGGRLTALACVFETNWVNAANAGSVMHLGGAIYGTGLNPFRIEDSVFVGNYLYPGGTIGGGAVYLAGTASSGVVARCVFARNGSGTYPGDTRVAGGYARFENILWHGNRTRGLWVTAGTVEIENCTLATNSTWGVDAAGGTVVVRNSLLWQNASGDTNGTAAVSYTLAGNVAGGVDGNLNGDPLFADADAGDYRLKKGSPAINAGLNALWMTDATDLAGEPRVRGGCVDMGAYEAPPLAGTVLMVR